jgi:redox-sensitive bicupin YhaK (pirin superfamily)
MRRPTGNDQEHRSTMTARTLRRRHPALRDDIADLTTRRPLPGPALDQIDPFLFLNHHGPQIYPPGNRGLPFGPHPHRGFETVTFILEGDLAHRDSGGHESVIGPGGVQWMTAGRGLVHSELSPEDFRKRGGPLEILQLWVNLPARLKMTEPRYVGLQRDAIPSFAAGNGGVTVAAVSGSWEGRAGAIETLTDVHMAVLTFAPGGTICLPVAPERNVFLYLVRGALDIAGERVEQHHLAEVNGDGDEVALEAPGEAVALFGHALPLGEPVVAHGPFVMNTREEILQAVEDYRAGRF